MPFKKGQVANPKGRIKGTTNKVTQTTREAFQMILDNNIDQLIKDLKSLSPRDRVKAILDMASYCVPKLSTTQIETGDDIREMIGQLFPFDLKMDDQHES